MPFKNNYSLRNYYKHARMHPRKDGKCDAVEMIDKILKRASKFKKQAFSLIKQLMKLDSKIRGLIGILEYLEDDERTLKIVGKYLTVGEYSTVSALKRKMEKIEDLPLEKKIALSRDLVGTAYENNPHLTLMHLAENIERRRCKLKKMGFEKKLKLDTPLLNVRGVTDIMDRLIEFYKKVAIYKDRPTDENDLFIIERRAIIWVTEFLKKYWYIPSKITARQIDARICKKAASSGKLSRSLIRQRSFSR